MNNKIT